MIIQCDHCNARFRLDDSKVTGAGVKVRCKRCRHIFLVQRDESVGKTADLDELNFEAPAAPPVSDAFSFPFEPEPQRPAASETAGGEESPPLFEAPTPAASPPATPQPDDSFFSFAEEPAAVVSESPSPLPEPAVSGGPAETDVSAPPSGPVAERSREGGEEWGWSDFTSVEAEGSEPGAVTEEAASAVSGEAVRIPVPAPSEEADAFDRYGLSPEPVATAPAHPEPAAQPVTAAEISPPSPRDETGASPPPFEAAAVPPGVPVSPRPAVTPEPPLTESAREVQRATEPPAGAIPSGSPVPATPASPPVSRRQGPSVIAVVGLLLGLFVLLLVGGVGALYLLQGPEALKKVGLGGVAGLPGAGQKAQERIQVRNLEGSYVTNREAGELFVIRGEAVNSFPTPRAAIQVRGMIYNAAGAVVLTKSSFCGNPLSVEQLTTLPPARIEQTLSNRLGESYANIGVPPGTSVPFVIVFTGLPKDAVDYGVEVSGSEAAGQ